MTAKMLQKAGMLFVAGVASIMAYRLMHDEAYLSAAAYNYHLLGGVDTFSTLKECLNRALLASAPLLIAIFLLDAVVPKLYKNFTMLVLGAGSMLTACMGAITGGWQPPF